jgi:hypothetical protein
MYQKIHAQQTKLFDEEVRMNFTSKWVWTLISKRMSLTDIKYVCGMVMKLMNAHMSQSSLFIY